MLLLNTEKMLFFILLIATEYRIGMSLFTSESAEGVDPCDPFKSCINLGAGAQVPNPIDCHSYYICISETTGDVVPSDHPLQCVNRQYFDTVTLQCERGEDECYQPCLNVDCQFECDVDETDTHNVANANDCSSYLVCVPGTGSFPATCDATTPYFNGVDCSDDVLDCCDGCVPFCHNVSTETRDPSDCRMYYICTDFGVPDESVHFMCDEGNYFDYKLGSCVVGDDCSPLCFETKSSKQQKEHDKKRLSETNVNLYSIFP